MAYDSATDTALAGQAYQRALAIAAQRRSQLNSQYGLNANGSLDNSAAGQLGDIYQTNLQSVDAEHQAELADRRRGFGGTGGLAGKASAAADRSAQQRQALEFRDANQQLGGVGQEEQFAGQDYQNTLGNINNKAAFDLANTLVTNPVLADQVSPFQATPASRGPQIGGSVTNFNALYKTNPKKFQTIKNKF